MLFISPGSVGNGEPTAQIYSSADRRRQLLRGYLFLEEHLLLRSPGARKRLPNRFSGFLPGGSSAALHNRVLSDPLGRAEYASESIIPIM